MLHIFTENKLWNVYFAAKLTTLFSINHDVFPTVCTFNYFPSTGISLMEAPWTKSPKEILEHYGVDPVRGLTTAQAAKHAQIYGKNGM